jgi:hypothetical protein
MRRVLRGFVAAATAASLVGGVAHASPVAQTKEERELYGRTFLEPALSYNYIQFSDGEFAGGMKLLEELFPRYMKFTTVAKELGSKHAVSVGADGYASWDKRDTGDGHPIHAAIVTDERVPDTHKSYVVLMASHQGEPCGREAMWRFLEDLLIAATEEPDRLFDNATGKDGEQVQMTAGEILKRTKIYFVSASPDGWAAGDGLPGLGGHSQDNGAAINSNRVAYQDGWSFPNDPVLFSQGYTTLTQPEGAATTKWLREVRKKELRGRPFAIAMDVHGPVPAGFILLHDQGNDPEKLERAQELGLRIRQNMEETMPPMGVVDSLLDMLSEQARRLLPDSREAGTVDQTAWRSSGIARWAFVTHIADALTYTAANTWGGWMNSRSGLDAVSLSYEINCRASSPWSGIDYQKWVDNMRAVFETGVVSAAAFRQMRPPQAEVRGTVAFLETGRRITDADGNPSPPPRGFPGHPLIPQIKQGHYDVSNTDYFRDLRGHLPRAPVEVRDGALSLLDRADTFVVADATTKRVRDLKQFAERGGNLILTDRALKMLPSLTGIEGQRLQLRYGYVGYSDLNRTHPWTHDLLVTARQMYDPTGLGYPLLMERDGYWQDEGPQGGSITKNSSPIWAVDRDAWEAAGGVTIGTVDPPEDRKATLEGTAEDLTNIGTLEVGKGRIVIFGALLPQPTEKFPHWFGLNGYTISAAGQTMLLRALDWERS